MSFSGIIPFLLSFIMIPIVYFVFKYTMKEKSYDERMAEQRKELSEHNAKSKSKHPPAKKSAKKVEKEPKKKLAPPSKEPKKSDASRNNPLVSSSTDKVVSKRMPNMVQKKRVKLGL